MPNNIAGQQHTDDDDTEREAPERDYFDNWEEDRLSQWDDDPDPYSGTYSED